MIRGGVAVFVGVLSYSNSQESFEELLNLPPSLVGLEPETYLYLNPQDIGETRYWEHSAAFFLFRCLSTQALQTRHGSSGYRFRAFVQAIALLLKFMKLLIPNYRSKVRRESLRAANICRGHVRLIEKFLMSDKDVAIFFEDDAKPIRNHLPSHTVLRQLSGSKPSILNLTESYRWSELSVQVGDSVYSPGRGQALLKLEPSVTNTVAAYAMNRATAEVVYSRLCKRTKNGATVMHFDWELNRILASSSVQALALEKAPFRQNNRFREPKI